MVVLGRCTAEPFSDQEVALRVESEVHKAYVQAQRRVIEQQAVDELRREIETKMRCDVSQSRVEHLRLRVIEDILTLRCPNKDCGQAFLDFDGCFALTCSKCSKYFCGYCLKHFGGSATGSEATHKHVTECKANISADGGLFASIGVFHEAQRLRREARLRQFFAQQPTHVRFALLEACQKDLAELGIDTDRLRDRLMPAN
mmetsp:Transcript_4403/g.10386  ORF Transcript_4403/g.10386 Transcript_4403/m.10386 type:complete len:201 (-) Transcript_4403:152-754(-)